MFLSKIWEKLAQVWNWLENQNFNFKIFRKNFERHSKNQFFELSWKAFAWRRQLLCSMSKNDWKTRISSSKSFSLQKVFTDTGRAVLTTSPGNFQREADFFSLNVRKIQNKYLIWKCFVSKRFYGHVASIFDDPVDKLKTKGWISSTQKNTRNLFRWKTVNQMVPMDTTTADSTTRPKNFYQKAKTFDRCPKNMEKKRKLLNTFFLIMSLWLHKMKFCPSCKSVFVKNPKKSCSGAKFIGKSEL